MPARLLCHGMTPLPPIIPIRPVSVCVVSWHLARVCVDCETAVRWFSRVAGRAESGR